MISYFEHYLNRYFYPVKTIFLNKLVRHEKPMMNHWPFFGKIYLYTMSSVRDVYRFSKANSYANGFHSIPSLFISKRGDKVGMKYDSAIAYLPPGDEIKGLT